MYKWRDGKLYRKARFSLKGDLTKNDINYDPRAVSCSTAEEMITRILFDMKEWNRWKIEQM